MQTKRPPGHLKIVKPKTEPLPPIEHPILNRKRVTSGGLEKYKKALLAALAPHMIPEAFFALRKGIAEGDMTAVQTALKSFEVLKSPGMNISQTNTNTAQAETISGFRNFDTFIRERAEAKGMTLDVTAAIEETDKLLENHPPQQQDATEE